MTPLPHHRNRSMRARCDVKIVPDTCYTNSAHAHKILTQDEIRFKSGFFRNIQKIKICFFQILIQRLYEFSLYITSGMVYYRSITTEIEDSMCTPLVGQKQGDES